MVSYPLPEYKKEAQIINYEFRAVPEANKVVYDIDFYGNIGEFQGVSNGGLVSGSPTFRNIARFTDDGSVNITQGINTVWDLTITNASDQLQNAVLFDAAINMFEMNNGNVSGIAVVGTNEGSTYLRMLAETIQRPALVNSLRISSETMADVFSLGIIQIQKKNASGQTMTYPIITSNYDTPFQFQRAMMDVNHTITLDSTTSITIRMPPNSNVKIALLITQNQ
jgi:hypothetical protein